MHPHLIPLSRPFSPREAIAAMDFGTVPTLTFNLLHCFFIIIHDRRRILHFYITLRPGSVGTGYSQVRTAI